MAERPLQGRIETRARADYFVRPLETRRKLAPIIGKYVQIEARS